MKRAGWFCPKTRWLPILLGIGCLNAQTCLVLFPLVISADGTASTDLSLYSSSGEAPAALQWTFQFPSSNITSITVDDGPALTSAGKTAICAGDAAAYKCLAVGANAKTIANGVIAKITAVLAPGATTGSIQMSNLLAASATGYLVPISSRIIPATGANVSNDCRLHPPPRGSAGSK